MFTTIENTKVYYEQYLLDDSPSSQTLVFLHGWGSNMRVFDRIISVLKANYNIYAIDLSGFGNSPEPDADWSVLDYSNFIEKFINYFNIQNPILLGHSFGGRISIRLAHKKIPSKIVLINSAGIIRKRGFSYKIKVRTYKFLNKIKKFPPIDFAFGDLIQAYTSKAGSEDYKRASAKMKLVLKKAVNEDLAPLMPEINLPTLLVWGDKDDVTPLHTGKKIHELIPNSKLVILKDTGHYSFMEKPAEFENALLNFLQEDR